MIEIKTVTIFDKNGESKTITNSHTENLQPHLIIIPKELVKIKKNNKIKIRKLRFKKIIDKLKNRINQLKN